MPKVTPGYQLYLYQLLARELGCGKQTLLPQVEEVLAADDIIPADLECESMQELAKACPDFLKVTVFKKGRVYITVLRNKEWDQMLAAPEEKPAAKKAAPSGGPKSWKKKKSGKKTLKAVKPGKRRREREAAEAQAAALRAEEEARAAEEALRTAEQEPQAPAVEAEEAKTQAEAVVPAADENADTGVVGEQPSSPEAELDADRPVAKTIAEILAESRTEEQAAATEVPIEPEPSPVPEAAEPEIEPEPSSAPDPAPEVPAQEAPAEPAAEADDSPAAPEPAPISLTITYDPYEDMERELAAQAVQQEAAAPQPAPAPAAPPAPSIPLAGLPQDFGREVSCSDALLRVLYQLLPFDAEPMAVLDEDWRVARSTGSLSGSRNRVSFPLRYLHEDGRPLTVTLRKATRATYGKQWNLILVDGDDGSGSSHDAVGFEGLPTADEGAWADLSGTAAPQVSPLRAFVQQVVIGSWDALLGSLATMAAPERWNYPGEGVGRQSRYGILRDYLCVSYRRLQCQQRIAQAPDGSFAAFNTGLATAFGDDIYACLGARKGDIPWQFLGFATAGSGELGARLVATISPLPESASYLSSLESVTPDHSRMVILDLESILTSQLGRLPRAFLHERLEGNNEASAILSQGTTLTKDDLARLARAIKADGSAYRRLRRALDDTVEQALRSTKASFRLSAPVYDPTENRTKLLLPLCLVEEGTADCALVLDLQPSGAYRAATLLSLPRAYACARVISREQPRWLEADRVL